MTNKRTENKLEIDLINQVFMKNLLNPFNFWVSKTSTKSDLKRLEIDLQKCFSSTTKKIYIKKDMLMPNELYACLNSFGFWCRAQVLGIKNDFVSTLFIDYGEMCQMHISQFNILPKSLGLIPHMAFQCSMENVSFSSQTELDKCMNILCSFVDKNTNFEIVCKSFKDDIHFVELFENGKNIKDSIFERKKDTNAINTSLESLYSNNSLKINDEEEEYDDKIRMKANHNCPTILNNIDFANPEIKIRVVHIINPNNFWVNIVSDQSFYNLKKLKDEMLAFYGTKEPKSDFMPNSQMLYAGLEHLGETDQWCRLNIIDINPINMTCMALLVDHGTIVQRNLENLYSLESQFCCPFIAVCCRISEQDCRWSNKEIDTFSKYVSSGIFVAHAVKEIDDQLLISIKLSNNKFLDASMIKSEESLNCSTTSGLLSSRKDQSRDQLKINSYNKMLPTSVEKKNALLKVQADTTVCPETNNLVYPNCHLEKSSITGFTNTNTTEKKIHFSAERINGSNNGLEYNNLNSSTCINTLKNTSDPLALNKQNGESVLCNQNFSAKRPKVENFSINSAEKNEIIGIANKNVNNNPASLNHEKIISRCELQYSSQIRKINKTDLFNILHIINTSQFYVVMKDNEISEISIQVANFCARNRPSKDQVITIGSCVACLSCNKFVRGCVVNVNLTSTVDVYCVDFGNLENVLTSQIVILADKLVKKWPVQAFQVGLFAIDSVSIEAEKWFLDNCLEKEFKSLKEIEIYTDKVTKLELIDSKNNNIADKLLSFNLSNKNSQSFDSYQKTDNKMNNDQFSGKLLPEEKAVTLPSSPLIDAGYKNIALNMTNNIENNIKSLPQETYDLNKIKSNENNSNKDDNLFKNDLHITKREDSIFNGNENNIKSSPHETKVINPSSDILTFNNTDMLLKKKDIETKPSTITENNRTGNFENADKVTVASSLNISKNVLISSVTSPSDFYVQKEEFLQKSVFLLDEMNKYYCNKTISLVSIDVGMLVAAKYDELWFRAKVVEKLYNQQYRIFFIDYGNTETVGTKSLQVLLPRFIDFCSLNTIFRCCLLNAIPNISPDWPLETIKWFKENLEYKKCVITSVPKCVDLILHIALRNLEEKNSVLDQMISLKLARLDPSINKTVEENIDMTSILETISAVNEPVKAETIQALLEVNNKIYRIEDLPKSNFLKDASLHVTVLSIVSLQDFHCQCLHIAKDIFEIMSKYNRTSYKPVVGELCCVFHDEYEEWYRGVVVKMVDDGALMKLIDYGEDTVADLNKMGPLTEQMLNYPPATIHCSLSGVKEIGENSLESFISLVENKKMIATVLGIKRDGKELVDLKASVEANSISSELIRLGFATKL